MSRQKEVLREIAQVINGNGDYRIGEWFTEDFRLIEPTKPNWPRRHEGASRLLDSFRTFTPPLQFVALDIIEEADRVAVRWQLSATFHGEPLRLAMIAIYRFREGRIAEAGAFLFDENGSIKLVAKRTSRYNSNWARRSIGMMRH